MFMLRHYILTCCILWTSLPRGRWVEIDGFYDHSYSYANSLGQRFEFSNMPLGFQTQINVILKVSVGRLNVHHLLYAGGTN